MKHKETYDRQKVGRRLQNRRKELGWTRKFSAESIGLAEKYYADIERGTCGMSIETLLAVTKLYGFTMDGLIFGVEDDTSKSEANDLLLKNLESLPKEAQDYCLQMILLFMKGIRTGNTGSEAAADSRQG